MYRTAKGKLLIRNRIFYFTGSGNSLAIARALAGELGDTEALPMAKHMGGFTGSGEERIGIVIPVYAWGPPRMARDFVAKLKLDDSQYVFAVADCAGSQGRTIAFVRKWLREQGIRLNSGFAVRGHFQPDLPGMGDKGLIKFIGWLGRHHVPSYANDRLSEICEIVASRRDHGIETSNASVNVLTAPIYPVAMRTFRTFDSAFSAGESCVSCGTCARVCPRENVEMIEEKPTWNGDCEACYACIFWCPQRAILFQGNPPNEPTHHSEVTLADMLLR